MMLQREAKDWKVCGCFDFIWLLYLTFMITDPGPLQDSRYLQVPMEGH
jgi:hypothetical protein